jgi:integrase
MAIHLEKRGDIYYLRGHVGTIRVRCSTKVSDEATAEAIRIKTEHKLLDQLKYGKKATVTFGEAALSYLEAPGTSPRAGRFLGTFTDGRWTGLMGLFFATKLSTIGQDELNKAARKLYPNENVSPATLNRQVYTPFVAVWRHAVRNKWAEATGWQRPRKPKGTNVARFGKRRAGARAVSYDDAAKFVAAMAPAPAMVMTALFYSGMRPIELFVMRAEHVDVGNRWIVIPHSKTTTEDTDGRGVPMHEFLVPLFESLVKRGGILFRTPRGEPYPVSGPDEHIGGGQLSTAINGARRRTGITNISPYTARHSCSVQLVRSGVDLHTKDQIMGHAVGGNISRVYSHMEEQDLKHAINKLPVPALWKTLWWWKDPVGLAGKLVPLSPEQRAKISAARRRQEAARA